MLVCLCSRFLDLEDRFEEMRSSQAHRMFNQNVIPVCFLDDGDDYADLRVCLESNRVYVARLLGWLGHLRCQQSRCILDSINRRLYVRRLRIVCAGTLFVSPAVSQTSECCADCSRESARAKRIVEL